MFFQHIFEKSLAQSSYIIGCQKSGTAAVIDPKRDVDIYVSIAAENNLTITHIFETHIHADFLSGSRELSALTGAELYLSDEGGAEWQYEFPHHSIHHGDTVKLGNVMFEVLHTPGHTPESISLLLTDFSASDQPMMCFTGDFLFVGDVGRPDLLEKVAGGKGTAKPGAHQLFKSLKTIESLPDFLQIWPGHNEGSVCGKALSAVPVTTVGYEKERNWAFKYAHDESGFVDFLLSDQPEAPVYFSVMKRLNKTKRPLLSHVPVISRLDINEIEATIKKGAQLVDTRSKSAFVKGFIPGSVFIPNNNSFTNWAGWLLSYEKEIVLVADEDQVDEIVRKLMRIGLDNVIGYLTPDDLKRGGIKNLESLDVVTAEEIESNATADMQIIDVRTTSEYTDGHIPNAHHFFLGNLLHDSAKLKKDKKIVVYCGSGDRSTTAGSLLKQKNFNNLQLYMGGINDWMKKGKEVRSENRSISA